MEIEELVYYSILLIVPALFFVGVILMTKPSSRESAG